MSTVDPIAALLADLDRPLSPRPEFAASLRLQLLAELRAPTRGTVAGSTNGRSGISVRRRRWTPRRRRLVLALAALVLAVVVVGSALAALGHDPFGRLGSWVGGSPGTPAPTIEARGFQTRNGASYASFPRHTRLRLLLHKTFADRQYSLLGFRDGAAFCLRLAPTRAPSSLGVNQCVPFRELRSSLAPALIASTAHFGVGKGAVDAVFGFADDTVRAVEIRHFRGDLQAALVASNAFLALHAATTNAAYDPIVGIRARTRDGRSNIVPFAPALGAQAPHGAPSYLGWQRVHLSGPASAVAASRPGAISWLAQKTPRGARFKLDPRFLAYLDGSVLLSRSIQPDASDPFRLGVSLVRLGRHPQPVVATLSAHSLIRLRPGELLVCLTELFPLRGKPLGSLCAESSPSSWPLKTAGALTARVMFRELFTRVSGVASDDVQSVDLVLAGGRVVPVALRDNVYTVEAPTGEFPAKLVAYDGRHRPLAVLVVPTHDRLVVKPCPPAATESTPSRTKPYERLDPRTGSVNGQPIFGQTLSEVVAALGRPDSISPTRSRPGVTTLTLSYGKTGTTQAALTIYFHRYGTTFQPVELDYRSPNLTLPRLGHVLRLQPTELQRRITSTYGKSYRLSVAYGSQPNRLGCTGSFQARESANAIVFGVDPTRSGQPFLTLRRPYR